MATQRPKHRLEGKRSIFVRFRNGFRLYIKNNIKETLQDLLPRLEAERDHNALFKKVIKDIADGSGLGVHPDSTWQSLIKEIFERYERDRDVMDSRTKQALIGLINIVCDERTVEKKWDEIKEFILENIEDLSNWTKVQRYKGSSFFGEIKRDKSGNYYIEENGRKIQVLGTVKNLQEERFEYITNDAIGDYGRLGGIIRLISLVDIGEQYKNYPSHFSKRVICSMPDNNYDSAYLHWRWYVYGAYDFIPSFWRPRSCYSDPQWLAADLIAGFSENQDIHKEFPPKLTDAGDFQRFQEAFDGYGLQFEIALETDLYLGDNSEVYFEFEGRKIRWINGTRFVSPTLTIPTNDPNYEDAIKIAKRFLSLLSKEAHISIVEMFNAASAKKFNPLIRQPRTIGGLGIDPRYIIPMDIDKYSEKQWIGLSLYREGANAKSIFYSFLSYFKVVQLAFEKSDKSEDPESAKSWINANIDKVVSRVGADWKTEVLKNGKLAGNHLFESRNIAAHIITEKGKINDPDDPQAYKRIQKDLHIIRGLADEIFSQKLL